MSNLGDVPLKTAQLNAVQRMLSFNSLPANDVSSFSSSSNQWKILIYDAACRSIISPILSVQQLRKRGVTLHLLLHADREPIPDVPAVYFCRPTKENLARIAQDCAKHLYAKAHLNFCTKLDRSLMEEFARLVVQSGSLSTIASVHDQYLDFCCLENNLFSLNKLNSYALYNGAAAGEQMMEQAMTEIAYGLFSVVATLGQTPVVRCARGGAPEMVARKLCKMMAEHPTLLQHATSKSSGSRPLLVILDRNADLITPVQHCSTYQALIDDVLQHKANRVEFSVPPPEGSRNKKPLAKRYDLDPDEDRFYATHKFQPFPEAIEENGSELQQVTAREQQIRLNDADLATAVDSLPALLEQKQQLEVHTSILQAVMTQVAARDVPRFFELEYKLATGSYKNDPEKAKKDVSAMVADGDQAGSVYDKLRLVLVYALSTGAKPSDIDQVSAQLEQAATGDQAKVAAKGIKAFQYIKQLQSMHLLPSTASMLQEMYESSPSDSGTGTSGGGTLSSLMAKATNQATGFLAKASDRVSSMMMGKIHKNHATCVVENLCEAHHHHTAGSGSRASTSEDETYLYLDPKASSRSHHEVDVSKLLSPRAPVREAIAFVIGGGCYGEYQNLQQMLANERRTIRYGSTEMLDPEAFVDQLAQLGGGAGA